MAQTVDRIEVIVSAQVTAFQRALGDAMASLAKFEGKAEVVGGRLQKIGSSLTVGLTAPLAAFGGLTLQAAGNFEAAMNKVGAITNSTGAQLQELEVLAKKLGATTVFSASEAADAMTFLGMAGFRTNQIMSALPDVLTLAQAGSLDLARAADIASNIMGQFGIAAEQTGRVTNVLAATATSANTNINQMAEAMAYIGPTAKSLGITLEETAAIIGVLGDSGIQGSAAGRALGTALVRLTKPPKETADALNRLGVTVQDSNGNFVSMANLLGQLERGLQGYTNTQKAAALSAIFGADAYQEINILLNKGGQALANYTDKITGTNKAQDMAQQMSKGFNNSLKSLGSAVEALQIAIGQSGLLGSATRLIEGLAELIRKVAALSPTMLKWGTIIAGVVAAIGPLTFAVGTIIKFIPVFTAGIKGLGVAFGVLTGPVGLTVMGISALAAGFAYAYSEIGPFRNAVNGLVNIITNLQKVFEGFNITDFFNPAKLAEAGNRAGNLFTEGFNSERLKGIEAGNKEAAERLKKFGVEEFSTRRGLQLAIETKGISKELKEAGQALIDRLDKGPFTDTLKKEVTEFLAQIPKNPIVLPVAPTLTGSFKPAVMAEIKSVGPIQLPVAGIDLPDLNIQGVQQITANVANLLDATFGLDKAFAAIDEKAILLGNTFNANDAKIQLLKNSMLQLVEEGFAATSPEVTYLQQQIEALTASGNTLSTTWQAIGSAMANSIGEAADGVLSGAKTIQQAVGGIIKAFIRQGVAAAIGNALTQSAFAGPFAIPIAAAAGKAAEALFSSMVPAFAKGGIVSGPTLAMVGEYPGARSNPEVIAPLSKLTGMLGNRPSQKVEVTGEIKGDAIRIVTAKNNSRRNLIS